MTESRDQQFFDALNNTGRDDDDDVLDGRVLEVLAQAADGDAVAAVDSDLEEKMGWVNFAQSESEMGE